MPKGLTTQTLCILLEKPASLDDIEAALSAFAIKGRRAATKDEWAFSGPALKIAYRSSVNGGILVDTVDRVWPDGMGDAKTDTITFGAWTLGQFGPFTFPGGLERAGQQCWHWEPGQSIAQKHRAFVRVRSSYVFDAGPDAKVLPKDYDPLHELEFVTNVAAALLKLPGVLCYFNPNGEVLYGPDEFHETLKFAAAAKRSPLELWSNVRLFNVNAEWTLMDSVGNGQLDFTDVETCFRPDVYDCNQVAGFIRNVCLYLFQKGDVIQDTHTMDGPGNIRWQAVKREDGICSPPRPVLRFVPMDGRLLPKEL